MAFATLSRYRGLKAGAGRIRTIRRLLPLFAVALAALLLVACGGDSEEEALEKVCNAADDIEQRVNDLATLTVATASAEQVEEDLNAIGEDLETIKDSAGDLRESERNEVEEAAQSLESTVDESLSEIGEGQSLEGPATEVFGAIDRPEQLESALGPLRSSIQALLTPIDCMA